MIAIKKKSECCGCEACVNACPQGCIQMMEDDEGFLYPKVNRDLCINCQICEKVCPIQNYTTPEAGAIKAYAVRAKDIDIREKSSSGGVFYYLAKYFFDIGGVIVAPIFDENFILNHKILADPAILKNAMGAKYVQSRIQNVFKEVRGLLEKRSLVYFTGTPCQVAALKKYLAKDYEGLVTQDIICHGVPSPGLWQKYIHYLTKDKKKIEQVAFRDKSRGWRGYSIRVVFENGREYCEPSYRDPYLKTYSRDLTSRPSCFECPFKGEQRESDITLGDFWGIENICPSMDDNRGTSLVMIHTEKGRSLFETITEKTDIKEVNCNKALSYNKAALQPATPSTKRVLFFSELANDDFITVMKKHSRDSKITEVKRFIKGLIHHGY